MDFEIGQRVRVVGLPAQCRVMDGWPENGMTGHILAIDDDCEDVWIKFDGPGIQPGQWRSMGWLDWKYLEQVHG